MQAYIPYIKNSDFLEEGFLSIYFSGCNFACPFCNTPSMLVTKEEFLLDTREIKKRITESPEETILLTGGEPTFQRLAVLEIARFAKSFGKKIILQTNGSKPETMKSLIFEKLIDLVLLDIKAPLEEEVFERATRSRTFFIPSKTILDDIAKTIELLSENSVKTLVIATIVPGVLFKKEDVVKIAGIADHLRSGLTLQQFDNSLCNDSRFMSIRPASLDFLQTLKDTVKKAYPNMRVELKTTVERPDQTQ